MVGRWRLVLCLSLSMCLLPPSLRGEEPSQSPPEDSSLACDDGKVGGDIADSKEWTSCQGEIFQPTEFVQPSSKEECMATMEESISRCMDTSLNYDEHPPSQGDYRQMRPKYGTYQFLPPQRWLSALQYGAVVFLYHPCAPPDQVVQMKQLAQACLWRHFISPYPHLNSDWPMAVVSWGCVLRVKWVESERLKEWVSAHALHTPLTAQVSTDGAYSDGMIQAAEPVEVDGKEIACPSHPHTSPDSPSSHPPTNHTQQKAPDKLVACPTPTPIPNSDRSINVNSRSSSQNSSQLCNLPPTPTCCPTGPSNSPSLSLHHHLGYTILLAIACIAILSIILMSAWNMCCSSHSRKRRARYKSVSKFFPFSYGQQLDVDASSEGVNVAIPEYGLPKSGRAEREMLLNESDEDEI